MTGTTSPLDLVRATIGEVNDLLCSVNLLTWDARTKMPKAGAEARGNMLATLTRTAHNLLTSDDFSSELARAEAGAKGEDAAELVQIREGVDTLRRIPARLLNDIAELKPRAGESWQAARRNDNFALFQPDLERMVDLNRELAAATGFSDHPYDALVGSYEPGMTSARLKTLFEELRGGILPLLAAIRERGAQPDTSFLSQRDYPVTTQLQAAERFAALVGYDFERGRVDRSAHPFEISFTRNDVRMTTRFNQNWMPMSLFGALHETGHALYEQGVKPEYVRTVFTTDLVGLYAVAGTSYGTHESQSRLWENLVGRSATFWQAHYPKLKELYPTQLNDVGVNAFVKAINTVRPGYIRVEADELTYNLHIMLRVELEMALLDGSLAVADIPEAWNEKTREYLGLEVPNNADGCLQDIHWSTGLIGAFSTYTIGNVMSVQWLQAAKQQDSRVAPALDKGDVAPLLAWLQENIYQHGRRYSADELLVRATGNSLTAAPYLGYLNSKYGELYDL